MSYERFVCHDTENRVTTCRGVVRSTNKPCKNPARDINGFCQKHTKQSNEYQKTHPWTIISTKEGSTTVFTKIRFIH